MPPTHLYTEYGYDNMPRPESPPGGWDSENVNRPTEQELNRTGLQFRLGTRQISAAGIICDHHRNVLHLQILPNWLDRLIWPLRRLLPVSVRGMLESRWPEWFLPPKIVLKRQKVGWDEEFDNEKTIYQRLAPLQGSVVPVCYGEAACPTTETTTSRALVLSDVGGIALYEDAAGGLETEHVEAMLLESLRAMTNLGVAHDDSKLDNYRLVGDKIVVIDFDSSCIMEKDEDPEFLAINDADFATRLYWQAHGGTQPKYRSYKRKT